MGKGGGDPEDLPFPPFVFPTLRLAMQPSEAERSPPLLVERSCHALSGAQVDKKEQGMEAHLSPAGRYLSALSSLLIAH